jgi:hypothetical protein
MALRYVGVVWQWLSIVGVVALLSIGFGWGVGALLAIAVLAFVATSVVARKRGRDPSALAWPLLIALMLSAFGAVLGDLGLAILGGLFGLVIGAISLIPLKHRDGTPYTDGEIARGGGLFFAVAAIVLFVLLVVATVAKAT